MSVNNFTFSEVPNPFGFDFSKGVIHGSVADFERIGEKFGSEIMERMIRLSEGYMKLSESCVSMQYAYSRAGSSVGSVSSGTGSVRSDGRSGASVGTPLSQGLMKARLDSVSKLKTWRRSIVPDGFCYSKMFKSVVSDELVASVGPHPALASLTRLSSSKFLSLVQLKDYRFVDRPGGVHVTKGGEEGVFALSAIKSFVHGKQQLPGSFGELVASASVPLSAERYSGACRVGSDKVLKSEKHHSLVMVSLGNVGRDASLLQRRTAELKSFLSSLEGPFDCLDLEEGDWGFVSSSQPSTTRDDVLKLLQAFTEIGYLTSTTHWGQVRVDYPGTV